MATTITSAFEQLATKLIPSQTERDASSKHRESVEAKLKDSLAITNFFQTGSSGNGTSLSGYSDADYFAVIPHYNQRDDSYYMLVKVKEVLQERFPSTDIYIRTPAVICDFGTNGSERLEVVPAYYIEQDSPTGSNIYKIPDHDRSWIRSAPRAHNSYVTEINTSLDNKLKPLIRLIKAIKYFNNIPVSSFYLEMRVAKWASTQKTIIYKYDVPAMLRELVNCDLAKMIDPAGISGYVSPCSTEAYRQDSVSKFNSALNRAINARNSEDSGKIQESFDYWDKVFGGEFPIYG